DARGMALSRRRHRPAQPSDRGPRLWLGLDDGARHAGPGLGRRAAAPWPWARPPFRPGGGLRPRAAPGVAPGGWRRAEPEPPREPARQRRDRELLLDAGAGTALRPTLRHTRRGALGAVRLYRGVLQPPAAPFDVGLPQPGGVRGANFNRGGVHRSGVSSRCQAWPTSPFDASEVRLRRTRTYPTPSSSTSFDASEVRLRRRDAIIPREAVTDFRCL